MPDSARGGGRLVFSRCLMTSMLATVAAPALAAPADPDEIADLKRQLDTQKSITQRIEDRLNQLMVGAISTVQPTASAAPQALANTQTPAQAPASVTPPPTHVVKSLTTGPSAPSAPGIVGAANAYNAGYDQGFYIKALDGRYSLHINGLVQPRFDAFDTSGTKRYGAIDRGDKNFDIFLMRLFLSGNIVDPSISYWITFQGATGGNNSNLSLLDAFVAKKVSPALKIEMGRYWSAYTYEYFDNIGKYLLPDLSAAEYAFSLGRQTGVRISGKKGRFTYSASVSNAIAGGDVGTNQNFHGKLAVIGNIQYDILAPYGYQETDPDPAGAAKPQLSLWVSAMYDPVEYSSLRQNQLAGDITKGGTASLNFRYDYLTAQVSGYYRRTDDRPGLHPGYNSWGWQEQAGYYLVPGRVELAQRVDQLHWGFGQIPATGGYLNQWAAGPTNFSYEEMAEYTGGINYYLSGHRVKLQTAYSRMIGKGLDERIFTANRLILQSQVAF